MSEPIRLSLDNQRNITRRSVDYDRTRYDNQVIYNSRQVRPPQRLDTFSQTLSSMPLLLPQNTKKTIHHLSRLSWALIALAILILAGGIFISLQAIKINHAASVQVKTLSKKLNNPNVSNSGDIPSIYKPTAQDISSYTVAPDLPRYITIPKLNVFARVMQVGVKPNGAVGAPSDVYDTAWYTGSAKPGQDGATLIDGHVVSWTTKGVFYNLKSLLPGDSITITKGNNQVISYNVVKTVVYSYNAVDMNAALTPIIAGKSGLSLITCTGQILKGTTGYDKRLVVFATEV